MKKLNTKSNANVVGVAAYSDPQINKTTKFDCRGGRLCPPANKQNGITLIALIITIIVMLILVGVTINVALNGGLFGKADTAKKQTQIEMEKEQLMLATLGAYDANSGVDFANMQLPEGFSGSNGTYMSSRTGKTYHINQKTAEITEGEPEIEKIVTTEDEEYSYWKTDKNGTILYYELPEGVEAPETLVVPCQIGDEKITTIGPAAFMAYKMQRNEDGSIVEKECGKIEDNYGNFDIYLELDAQGECIVEKISNIKNIIISKEIEKIGVLGFGFNENCSKIAFPSSLKTIGGCAFFGCTALTSIEFEIGIEAIDGYAFAGCTSLTNVKLPNGLTTLKEQAFAGCTGVKEITIPTSVENMEYEVFSGWTNEQTIYMKLPEEPLTKDEYTGPGWSKYWNRDCNANVRWGS